MHELIYATLRLFHAVPLLDTAQGASQEPDNAAHLRHGFFLTQRAVDSCPAIETPRLLKFIERQFGYDAIAMNRGLHKNFHEIADASTDKLFIEQMLHYFSVYLQNGDMTDGRPINESLVYVPNSVLHLPEDTPPFRFVVIDAISAEEIGRRVRQLLTSGAALSEATMNDLDTILKELKIAIHIDEVKNKEMRLRLYRALGEVPEQAEEFLRYLVYRATDSTLFLKNEATFEAIRQAKFPCAKLFHDYLKLHGEEEGIRRLSQVFLRHRNKVLFLAFKGRSKFVNHVLNRARKLANKNKVPKMTGILDRVTWDAAVTAEHVQKELAHVTTFKKVALANSLLFQKANPEAAIYRIRNGKAFAKPWTKDAAFDARQQSILELLIASIVDDLRPAVEGKSIFLPPEVDYAMPTSEKRFFGGIPYQSSLTIGKSVVLGMHWENVQRHRIDLDLHFNSARHQVGWNTQFEDALREKKDILFSGDMTSAPKSKGGATEAFYISENIRNEFAIVEMNHYTAYSDWYYEYQQRHGKPFPVPYKFVLGAADPDQLSHDYLIHCQNMMANIPNTIEGRSDFLGFLESAVDGTKTFWFMQAQIGNDLVAYYDHRHSIAATALKTVFHSCLKLRPMLEKAGARFEKPEGVPWDIDLSLDKITKDSILSLFPSKHG